MNYRTRECDDCDQTIELHGDTICPKCGAEYNAFGQRLRDDWHRNPSTWDSEIGDLEGYEQMYAGDD